MSTSPKLKEAPEILAESPIMNHPQVRALIYSVLVSGGSFNTLERELFKIFRELFVKLLGAVLEAMDKMILHSAIREGWEVADIHERELETSLGIVRYKRRYYKKRTIDGGHIYGYLLDDLLGLERGKNLTPRLVQMALMVASNNSYRKTASILEELLGVKISHESIRQAVLAAGEHISQWDQETALDGTGKKVVPILIIEIDGTNLKRQLRKKSKKKRKDQKTFELKTAVVYEGWESTITGETKLKNPQYFVYVGEGKEFWEALERHLSRTYDLDGCRRVIVGGDGATWVRQGAEILGAEYQYCRFHLERDMRQLFGGTPELKQAVRKILENNDREAFNILLETLKKDEKDSERRKRLIAFQSLINSVWEGIIDWRKRGKPVPENARGLGVIEANIGHTITRRFKHQCASWTPHGAHCLAKVRCAVRNGNLKELTELKGPPRAVGDEARREYAFNGYWAKKETDGVNKTDPAQWCKATMPAAYGPDQRARELAKVISQLTTEWLF
ncbi:ISLre2 family transposase [Calderihabitans maritimus]|uniref:Transposase n=1 Tax=Calderihabitans maritimus TaxID=1246530 RepID=A0A1Z5HV57_9FIRM|nr:ISLre2 family transposase [Calderihabitans maritimus]GAW93394.1 hypothetical protein Moth_2232 [Calderihabitans maritimus]